MLVVMIERASKGWYRCVRSREPTGEGQIVVKSGVGTSIAAVALLVLAGCSTVPVEQVQGYTQAFDQASAAGNRLYDQVGPVIAREQAKADADAAVVAAGQAGGDPSAAMPAAGPMQAISSDAICPEPTNPPPPYHACFVPSDFAPGGLPGEPASLVARRRALATITTYNAIALRLASGETANALGAEVQRLGSNASSLAALTGAGVGVVPLIGVSSELAAKLASWAESLRADQELRAALANGKPLIEQLVQALIADTPRMYAFRREEVSGRLDNLKADAKDASIDIKAIVQSHASFATIGSMDRRYAAATSRISGLPFTSLSALAGTKGTTPLDAASADKLEALLAGLEATSAEYAASLAALDRYYDALGEYVAMLHRSNEALQLVAGSAQAPQAVALDPVALAASATEVRDRAREIERLLEM